MSPPYSEAIYSPGSQDLLGFPEVSQEPDGTERRIIVEGSSEGAGPSMGGQQVFMEDLREDLGADGEGGADLFREEGAARSNFDHI